MVRIRPEKPQRTTAVISFVMALVAALAIFLGWRFWWRRNAPEPPRQRNITDLTVTWECPTGERFDAPGGYKPLPCSQDGDFADIVLRFDCQKHGRFDCFVRYTEDAAGYSRITQVRHGQGEWLSAKDGVRCPRCERRADRPDPWPANDKKGR